MIKFLNNIFNNAQNKAKYIIGNKTHLIEVANAINLFSKEAERINKKAKAKADLHVITEFTKIMNLANKESYSTIKTLMQLEKTDKEKLRLLIEDYIVVKLNNPNFLMKYIKSSDDAENIAYAIGVIDDYIKYLKTGEYSGPTTEVISNGEEQGH